MNKKVSKRFPNLVESTKKSKKYHCACCDYYTCDKSNYAKHLQTIRHTQKKVSKGFQKVVLSTKKKFSCEFCEKTYKSKSGLWKHKKQCKKINDNHVVKPKKMEDKIILDKDEYIELLEKQNQMIVNNINNVKNVKNVNSNNTLNQNISINVFLNEYCKDAMSLEDFINKLQVTIKDIQNTKKLGYVDGMSGVFIKSLNDIPDTERPIHSTNKKKTKFIVKEEGGWKEDDGSKVDSAVSKVKFKHVDALTDWEKENPNYKDNVNKMNEWQTILDNINPGVSDKEIKKNNKAVKKNIADVVDIKEAIDKVNNNNVE